MAARTCMNLSCGTSTTTQWHRGWALRSGLFADLCDNCASIYNQSTFCDVFHSNDSGWRECNSCGKRLHCGCIASVSLLDLLDTGGINCINCAKNSWMKPIVSNGNPDGSGTSKVEHTSRVPCASSDNQFIELKDMKLGTTMEYNRFQHILHPTINETNGSFMKMKQEEILPPMRELGSSSLSIFSHASSGEYKGSKADIKQNMGTRDIHDSFIQTNLSMSLGTPLENPFHGAHIDDREQTRASPILQGPRSRHLLPKPPRPSLLTSLDTNSELVSQMRVARPPAEGRGRNQLLPRYWPRITDQELQQLSGDSNSTIVPLFEKMLSASDAGRIGRLVLPKACAEAYFPPISQPEGLPLRIQDVKGKEWVFQFRFWPNNNSRMYVLEGVTACIQSMQLQAGDTVTFSRMDPEGKLIMGFRKASNTAAIQTLKGGGDPDLNLLSRHWSSATVNIDWHSLERSEDRSRESLMPPGLAPEKKRARNIGSKSKRLHIDCHDALELKLTWEEVQDLLRPPLTASPSTVIIEDHLFEEYEEPPVFGKRSIFVVRSNGVEEQWAQCDSCSKWRRLPVDILLPPKWSCADNSWDPSRCLCCAPDELTPREVDNLLRLNKEFRKWKLAASQGSTMEPASCGIDALANAAVLGDNVGDSGTSSVATTTKHPRHRPGCSCIVCIQPPSGKGKHKPTCTCNVCMTVKRRFKTLMMRKKKRQSEREAEIAEKSGLCCPRNETEAESTARNAGPLLQNPEDQTRMANELVLRSQSNVTETSKGQLDLNCQPNAEKKLVSNCVSMMSLVQEASLPLDTYLKENGLMSLMSEQEAESASNLVVPATNKSDGQQNEDSCPTSVAQEQESDGEENNEADTSENDPV